MNRPVMSAVPSSRFRQGLEPARLSPHSLWNEIYTFWKNLSNLTFRKQHSMGTPQKLSTREVTGASFSRFIPKRAKSSSDNPRPPWSYLPIRNGILWDPPCRLQTVRAFFLGFSDELGSFWRGWKNQKSGRENR